MVITSSLPEVTGHLPHPGHAAIDQLVMGCPRGHGYADNQVGGLASAAMLRVPAELLVHLRRARDLADRRYSDPLDLDALAAAAGVSKYHFLRCFAATYGKTPAVYLAQRRIERAQDLLRATNLTVTEVCLLVGYTSLGSFSTKFTQLVGTAPSDYQATFARQGAPRIPGCYVFMHGLSHRKPDSAISEKPLRRPAP